jgi:VIT1/CCC1 family predicted Fe2+/Mn2+ transporter
MSSMSSSVIVSLVVSLVPVPVVTSVAANISGDELAIGTVRKLVTAGSTILVRR